MTEPWGVGVQVGVMMVPARAVGMRVPVGVPAMTYVHIGLRPRVVVEITRSMGVEMGVVMVPTKPMGVVVAVAVAVASPTSVAMVTRQEGTAA